MHAHEGRKATLAMPPALSAFFLRGNIGQLFNRYFMHDNYVQQRLGHAPRERPLPPAELPCQATKKGQLRKIMHAEHNRSRSTRVGFCAV